MPGSRVKVVVEPRLLGRSCGTEHANTLNVLRAPNQNNEGEITTDELPGPRPDEENDMAAREQDPSSLPPAGKVTLCRPATQLSAPGSNRSGSDQSTGVTQPRSIATGSGRGEPQPAKEEI